MSLLSTMFGWFRGNATAQRQGSQTALPSASAYEESVSVGPDSALQVSTVWACVKLLVETIAKIGRAHV